VYSMMVKNSNGLDHGKRRCWKIYRYSNYVIGSSQLKVASNSLFLNYVLPVPYEDGTLDLNNDDQTYLVYKNGLINESVMTK
jgi:hypothetical protein